MKRWKLRPSSIDEEIMFSASKIAGALIAISFVLHWFNPDPVLFDIGAGFGVGIWIGALVGVDYFSKLLRRKPISKRQFEDAVYWYNNLLILGYAEETEIEEMGGHREYWAYIAREIERRRKEREKEWEIIDKMREKEREKEWEIIKKRRGEHLEGDNKKE